MKIAACQFNPTVGAVEKNVNRMLDFYVEAAKDGAELVVFPEMASTGYPIEDLALSKPFLEMTMAAQDRFIRAVQSLHYDVPVIFGGLYPYDGVEGEKIAYNAAYFVTKTAVDHITKHELPNYGVFDEKRTFAQGPAEQRCFVWLEKKLLLGVMICEDCWFPTVTKDRARGGADILIAINGSPFEAQKDLIRRMEVAKRKSESSNAAGEQLPFLYVNMVGGQDELVFDGGSFAMHSTIDQAPFFEEDLYYFDVPVKRERPTNIDFDPAPRTQSIYCALVLGLRDYMRKQGFQSVVLGMSGGVDSGIVAAIACDAIGPDNVHLVRLPSKFSSGGSLTDAENAAAKLGAHMRTIAIEPVVNALRLAYTECVLDTKDVSKHVHDRLEGVADENIQARARGNILMAISNQENHLLLTTGNKSEVSVGYSTLYGDMAGGFNPIKDCYKTTVWDLCRWRNEQHALDLSALGFLGNVGDMVPEEIIVKPPSAELREDQKDEDSLPPYHTLDAILMYLVEARQSVEETAASVGADIDTVRHIRFLLDRAEYKRRQAAPGIKITSKLHGRERRVPIVNHFDGETFTFIPQEAPFDDAAN